MRSLLVIAWQDGRRSCGVVEIAQGNTGKSSHYDYSLNFPLINERGAEYRLGIVSGHGLHPATFSFHLLYPRIG